jgi:hypothetical protein
MMMIVTITWEAIKNLTKNMTTQTLTSVRMTTTLYMTKNVNTHNIEITGVNATEPAHGSNVAGVGDSTRAQTIMTMP